MTDHLESATRLYLVQEIERLRARVRELEEARISTSDVCRCEVGVPNVSYSRCKKCGLLWA